MAENETEQENDNINEQARAGAGALSNPDAKKKILTVGFMGICGVGALYYIFMYDDTPTVKKTEQEVKEEKLIELADEAVPVTVDESPIPIFNKIAPKIPDLKVDESALRALNPPAPPPPAPPEPSSPDIPAFPPPSTNFAPPPSFAPPKPPQPDIKEEEKTKKSAAGISVIGGGGGGAPSVDLNNPSSLLNPGTVGNLVDGLGLKKKKRGIDEIGKLERTSAPYVTATYIGDMGYTVTQDTIINAVLETPINTSLPGELRAVISRDVKAKRGGRVLIKRGSIILGKYDSSVSFNTDRVPVTWKRIISSNGIDVNLEAIGVDDLGRSGVVGEMDTRLLPKLANIIFTSIIELGAQATALKYFEDRGISTDVTTTTNTDGSSQTSGNQFAQATGSIINDAGKALSTTLKEISGDMKPVIIVPQGTRLNLALQQDIEFPPAAFVGYSGE